jgi:hypothetical protein
VIEHRVDVGTEPVGIDRRRARERGNGGVRSNELTRAQWDQFADRYAVARHNECLASVERAHDVAAAVAEFALGDFAIEANDEWLVGRSYISLGSMATLYDNRSDGSLSFGSEEEVAELAAA